jgi:4-hydroxy-3-methylbut-2-enyl diphosphate reductase
VQAVIDRLKELGAKSVRALDGVQEAVTFPLPKGLEGPKDGAKNTTNV